MNALTLRQPWAWALRAGKRVENREWAPPGHALGRPLAIHAGTSLDIDALLVLERVGVEVPPLADMGRGAVVAVCRLDEVVREAPEGQEQWWAGPYGLVLSRVVELETPVPMRGRPDLWVMNAEEEMQVLAEVPQEEMGWMVGWTAPIQALRNIRQLAMQALTYGDRGGIDDWQQVLSFCCEGGVSAGVLRDEILDLAEAEANEDGT